MRERDLYGDFEREMGKASERERYGEYEREKDRETIDQVSNA